jgi:peptidyl-tRNA hydrolase
MKRPQGGVSLENFVLKSFSISERRQLPEIFETVKKAIETIIFSGVEVAMNKFN